MLNLSPNELKATAKIRCIKGYKSMFKDLLLSALKESELLKESEKNFDDTKPNINFSRSRIEKIRKKINELRHKFSESKIIKIRKILKYNNKA